MSLEMQIISDWTYLRSFSNITGQTCKFGEILKGIQEVGMMDYIQNVMFDEQFSVFRYITNKMGYIS